MNKIVASSGEQRTLEELEGAGDRLDPAYPTASAAMPSNFATIPVGRFWCTPIDAIGHPAGR
jgi:hypothetical protein